MKNKISIIILMIILMTSVYVYRDKKKLIEYKKIQNELIISESENKRLISELETSDSKLDELEANIIKKNSSIKLKDKEIIELNNHIKNMQSYLKVYEKRAIYSDYKEEKRTALNIKKFDEYEIQLFSTENIEELFELYRQNLDGAYSEGYGAKLYDYYKTIGEMEFIERLEPYSIYKTNGIIDHLATEMSLNYFNDGVIDMEAHSKSLLETLDSNDLSYKEKYIIYKIVATIEEMVNYKKIY